MSKEGGPKWLKRAGQIGLAGLVLWPPIQNADITLKVLEGLTGSMPNCADTLNTPEKPYKFDAIVVPGAGVFIASDTGLPVPGTFSRRRLDAAAHLYVSGQYSDHFILLDGIQDPNLPRDTSKEYLQRQVAFLSKGTMSVPDSAFDIDSTSINTQTNMDELYRIIVKRRMRNVLVVDDEFHSLRTEVLACAAGVPATMMTVESTIAIFDPERLPQILKQNQNPPMLGRRIKENLELFDLMYFRGYFETAIKEKLVNQ